MNSQFSILHSPFSTLNSPFSILNSQFSILNSQFSILNSPNCRAKLQQFFHMCKFSYVFSDISSISPFLNLSTNLGRSSPRFGDIRQIKFLVNFG